MSPDSNSGTAQNSHDEPYAMKEYIPVPGNVSPFVHTTDDLGDLEDFPSFSLDQDPYPYDAHCTQHCHHQSCLMLRSYKQPIPRCSCYSHAQKPSLIAFTPTDYNIGAAIAMIKFGAEISGDYDDKNDITIWEMDFEKVLGLVQKHDVFDEDALCDTEPFKENLIPSRARYAVRQCHDEVIEAIRRSFLSSIASSYTVRRVSPHDLNLELAGCLGIQLKEFFEKFGQEKYLSEEKNPVFGIGNVNNILELCPLFQETWEAWGRVVNAVIEILVAIDQCRIAKEKGKKGSFLSALEDGLEDLTLI